MVFIDSISWHSQVLEGWMASESTFADDLVLLGSLGGDFQQPVVKGHKEESAPSSLRPWSSVKKGGVPTLGQGQVTTPGGGVQVLWGLVCESGEKRTGD